MADIMKNRRPGGFSPRFEAANGTREAMERPQPTNCARLKKKLQTIDFAIVETTLYLDAYPHSRVALEDIISTLHLGRGEQNALYSVMLTQSPVNEDGFMLDGSKMTFKAVPTGRVKMDMILELAKKESCYLLRFSYASTLFERETVAFWGRCIARAIAQMIKHPESKLSDISLLGSTNFHSWIVW